MLSVRNEVAYAKLKNINMNKKGKPVASRMRAKPVVLFKKEKR